MSIYTDKKYVSLLSPRLQRFHQKSEYLWNFRCPVCGDSSKNKMKARGYIYRRKHDLCYSCHNCGVSMTFGNFLKVTDRSLYNDYLLERFETGDNANVAKPDFSKFKTKPLFKVKPKINLPTVQSLPEEHFARRYVMGRKLPQELWSDIYYCHNFREFLNEFFPEYDKLDHMKDETCLVFPFRDENGDILGIQRRDFSINSKVKYITIKLDDDNRKVFGLDRLDKSKRVYVFEGPLDSMFIPNSVATMDATLTKIIPILGDLDYVFVHDNQPRNKDVVNQMKKTISLKKNICVWPDTVKDFKDLNDMVVSGMSVAEIQDIIDRNTFNDLEADLEFARWNKT